MQGAMRRIVAAVSPERARGKGGVGSRRRVPLVSLCPVRISVEGGRLKLTFK